MPFARGLTRTGAQRTMQALCSIAQTGVQARIYRRTTKPPLRGFFVLQRHCYAHFLWLALVGSLRAAGFGMPVLHTPPSASHPRSFPLLGGLAVFLFFSKQGPKP